MCAPQSKYLRQKLNCCDNAKFPNYKAVMDGSKKRSLPLRYAAFNGYLNRLVEDGDTRWIFFNPVVTHFVWWGPGGALRGAATASLSRWNGQQQKQVWKLKNNGLLCNIMIKYSFTPPSTNPFLATLRQYAMLRFIHSFHPHPPLWEPLTYSLTSHRITLHRYLQQLKNEQITVITLYM